jgi:oxalate decarboxylase/phosphoglucose isomerase-like protein (cupin superfamily)
MQTEATTTAIGLSNEEFWSKKSPHDHWMESTGVPIHEGYFIPDARTVELGPWEEREMNVAFLKLAGQEGVTEARVSEIPPGASPRPQRFAFDEAVYVLEGRGLTTIWIEGGARRTFEWQAHSMFLLPRGCYHQFSNAQGHRPARLIHFNYLPMAFATLPDPAYFFNNPYTDPWVIADDALFAEAKIGVGDGPAVGRSYWTGNFFPDMRAWDRLDPFRHRGAGGHVVSIRFPRSPIWSHMSVFPAQTYKKAHRHGPGILIVIPSGEGFSVMWPEGQEKVFIPWHEGSVFVPPNRWFHQHFNLGEAPARYLALHAPRHLTSTSEKVEDLARDQIEYANEDPWIRQTFESELAKRGLTSAMPNQAYREPGYEWAYKEDG